MTFTPEVLNHTLTILHHIYNNDAIANAPCYSDCELLYTADATLCLLLEAVWSHTLPYPMTESGVLDRIGFTWQDANHRLSYFSWFNHEVAQELKVPLPLSPG